MTFGFDLRADRQITTKCTGAAKSGRFQMENHLSPPGDFGRYPPLECVSENLLILQYNSESNCIPLTHTKAQNRTATLPIWLNWIMR